MDIEIAQPAAHDATVVRHPKSMVVAIKFGFVAALLFGFAGGIPQSPCGAQESQSPQAPTEAPNFQAIQEEVRQQIERLTGVTGKMQSDKQPVPTLVSQELELWQRLELITEERRANWEYLKKQQATEAQDPFQTGSLEVPRSFLQVDALRAELQSREKSLEALRLELESDEVLADEAREELLANERDRRRLEDHLEESQGGEKLTGQQQQALSSLKSRVLEAQSRVHQEHSRRLEHRIEIAQKEADSIRIVLDANRQKFQLTRDDLAERLQFIEDREAEVRYQLDAVDARIRATMYVQASSNDPNETTASEVAREESQLLRQLLSSVGSFKEIWRRRYLLSNDLVSADEVETWLEEAEQTKLRIAQIQQKIHLRTNQRQEKLALLRRAEQQGDASVDQATASQRMELERSINFYSGIQVLVSGGDSLCQFLVDDLNNRQSQFSIGDNLRLVGSVIVSTWEYEIANIDDEPITVKKIVIGLILLLCGYFLNRAVASMVAFRVLPRFGISRSGAAVLRTVLFYVMMVALVFLSLDIVNVPLTVFAFLGGAVAIGIGFGSQNLINNFISGLILLVERPIRIGDLVNVDGIDANVEHIGARSTRIRTGDDLEILVPNSKFLENNVTNWTLSDTQIRTSVTVGVAYGSPVKLVIELLREVIRETDAALTTPEPIVLFQDFGDNSLAFEVYFWVHMRTMIDSAKVRSSVRAAIDEAFRTHGISIAFPQRDVHIDMQSPLEVRLADPQGMRSDGPLQRPVRRAA